MDVKFYSTAVEHNNLGTTLGSSILRDALLPDLVGNNSNRTRIYKLKEMEADHVTAWANGGSTDISNCQMLCKTHNRAKGNR